MRTWILAGVAASIGLFTARPASAQTSIPSPDQAPSPEVVEKQDDLSRTHSILQKTGLGTLAVSGALGAILAINHRTAFSEGRCAKGKPILGDFGCTDLKYLHFAFAAATLGLFVATEVVAENMPRSPYESVDSGRETAMRTARVANIGLFAAQPIVGLLAANPGILGIKQGAGNFSSVMRTVHIGMGGALATSYTVNAAMQW